MSLRLRKIRIGEVAVEFSESSNPMIHREQKCIVAFCITGFRQ